jgi:hypothetical protein
MNLLYVCNCILEEYTANASSHSHPAVDSSVEKSVTDFGPALGLVCRSRRASVRCASGYGAKRKAEKQHIVGPAVTVTSASGWVTWSGRTQISRAGERGRGGRSTNGVIFWRGAGGDNDYHHMDRAQGNN